MRIPAYAALAAVAGTDVRYGDYIHEAKCLPCLHVEDGVVWQSDGEGQWIA